MFTKSEIAIRFAEELAAIGNSFFSKIQANDLRRFSLFSSTGGYWEVDGPAFYDFSEATIKAKEYGTYPVIRQSDSPYISSESDMYSLYFSPIYANVSTWYDIQKCGSGAMKTISNVLSRYGLRIWVEEFYDGYYEQTNDLRRMNRIILAHL